MVSAKTVKVSASKSNGMKTIKKVDVLSLAAASGILGALFMFVAGLFMLAIGSAAMMAEQITITSLILSAVAWGIFSFALAALMAVIYNTAIVKWLGGIKVELR